MEINYTTEENHRLSDLIDRKIWENLLPDLEKLAISELMEPVVEITDSKNELTLQLSAPGFDKKDFIVQINDDELLVFAEKDEPFPANEEKFPAEFPLYCLKRVFVIPREVVKQNIRAKYVGETLEIILPKKGEKTFALYADVPVE